MNGVAYPSRSREYERHMNRMIAYGRWKPYVDAEPARRHVRRLMALGMGPVTISRVSGIPHGAISKLVYGDYARNMAPSKRIRPATEAALLAVRADLENFAPRALVESTGTLRRLRALVAMGYSVSALGRRLGKSPQVMHRTMRSDLVRASTALAVRDLYEELSMTPGPSHKARLFAAERGWPPPLAWDDDDLDDPDARPRCKGIRA